MTTELKTSEEWNKQIQGEITILDPDGWDRKNFQFSWHEELIDKNEFQKRMFSSTIESNQSGLEMLDKLSKL